MQTKSIKPSAYTLLLLFISLDNNLSAINPMSL